MKWLGVFLLLPRRDASPSQCYPQHSFRPVPIYIPGWREALWEKSVLPKNAKQSRTRTTRSGVVRANHEDRAVSNVVKRKRTEPAFPILRGYNLCMTAPSLICFSLYTGYKITKIAPSFINGSVKTLVYLSVYTSCREMMYSLPTKYWLLSVKIWRV